MPVQAQLITSFLHLINSSTLPDFLLHPCSSCASSATTNKYINTNTNTTQTLMAACGSLHHIFETPLPENPSLLESLSSWSSKSIKPVKHTDHQPLFTEIFGELHFKENPQSKSSSVFGSINKLKEDKNGGWSNITEIKDSPRTHKKSDSFTSMNFESLQLCTEGLGFESSADVEDTKNLDQVSSNKDWEKKRVSSATKSHFSPFGNYHSSEVRRSRVGAFPPPISSIGKSGKPGVCFKSYREDGRFVLKEIRIPSQEFLHASREDGRLKMHFVHSNNEIPEAEDEEEDEENKQEGEDEESDN